MVLVRGEERCRHRYLIHLDRWTCCVCACMCVSQTDPCYDRSGHHSVEECASVAHHGRLHTTPFLVWIWKIASLGSDYLRSKQSHVLYLQNFPSLYLMWFKHLVCGQSIFVCFSFFVDCRFLLLFSLIAAFFVCWDFCCIRLCLCILVFESFMCFTICCMFAPVGLHLIFVLVKAFFGRIA